MHKVRDLISRVFYPESGNITSPKLPCVQEVVSVVHHKATNVDRNSAKHCIIQVYTPDCVEDAADADDSSSLSSDGSSDDLAGNAGNPVGRAFKLGELAECENRMIELSCHLDDLLDSLINGALKGSDFKEKEAVRSIEFWCEEIRYQRSQGEIARRLVEASIECSKKELRQFPQVLRNLTTNIFELQERLEISDIFLYMEDDLIAKHAEYEVRFAEKLDELGSGIPLRVVRWMIGLDLFPDLLKKLVRFCSTDDLAAVLAAIADKTDLIPARDCWVYRKQQTSVYISYDDIEPESAVLAASLCHYLHVNFVVGQWILKDRWPGADSDIFWFCEDHGVISRVRSVSEPEYFVKPVNKEFVYERTCIYHCTYLAMMDVWKLSEDADDVRLLRDINSTVDQLFRLLNTLIVDLNNEAEALTDQLEQLGRKKKPLNTKIMHLNGNLNGRGLMKAVQCTDSFRIWLDPCEFQSEDKQIKAEWETMLKMDPFLEHILTRGKFLGRLIPEMAASIYRRYQVDGNFSTSETAMVIDSSLLENDRSSVIFMENLCELLQVDFVVI